MSTAATATPRLAQRRVLPARLKYQTLAFHTAWTWAGASTGHAADSGRDQRPARLRLSAFTGNRRFLFNIEDRIYVWTSFFACSTSLGRLLRFGYAWPSSSSIKLADLKRSVAWGCGGPSARRTTAPCASTWLTRSTTTKAARVVAVDPGGQLSIEHPYAYCLPSIPSIIRMCGSERDYHA